MVRARGGRSAAINDGGAHALEDTEWNRGKCAFKIVQYMSVGVPFVASAVGLNARLAEVSGAGFIASTEEEWTEALSVLLRNEISEQRWVGKAENSPFNILTIVIAVWTCWECSKLRQLLRRVQLSEPPRTGAFPLSRGVSLDSANINQFVAMVVQSCLDRRGLTVSFVNPHSLT